MDLLRGIIKWLPISGSIRRRIFSAVNERQYRKEIIAARQAKDSARAEELRQFHLLDLQEEYEWEEVKFTRKLVRRARQLRVDIPPRPVNDWTSEHWILSQSQGDWYLTSAGINIVREAIRTEKRWQREQRAHYITWFTAIAGLIGTITGLVAVLSKFR